MTRPPTRTARRWPAPAPARLRLRHRCPRALRAHPQPPREAAAAEAAAAEAACGAGAAAGRGDPHRGGGDRAVGGGRAEGADTVTDGEVGRAAVWVALTVVELDVVTVSFSVLGVAGFLVLLSSSSLIRPGEVPQRQGVARDAHRRPADRRDLAGRDRERGQLLAEVARRPSHPRGSWDGSRCLRPRPKLAPPLPAAEPEATGSAGRPAGAPPAARPPNACTTRSTSASSR